MVMMVVNCWWWWWRWWWLLLQVIELRNDGAGFGFGISGSRNRWEGCCSAECLTSLRLLLGDDDYKVIWERKWNLLIWSCRSSGAVVRNIFPGGAAEKVRYIHCKQTHTNYTHHLAAEKVTHLCFNQNLTNPPQPSYFLSTYIYWLIAVILNLSHQ